VASKLEGLGMKKMEFVLQKLAYMHAASAVYFERNGSFDEKFSRGVYNVDMASIFDQHYDTVFNFIVKEFFSSWPNLDKKIIDKMVRIIKLYIFN
jgi:hypothetical protein